MPESINSKLKEQYDHDDSGGSLDTNLGDFLDSESASGTSNNTKWRNWAEGTGTSLNTRLFNKHGGSGSFMTRWKNWVAFSSTHSINFDGSNDYLHIPSLDLFETSASGTTWSAWIKPTNTSSGERSIVGRVSGVNQSYGAGISHNGTTLYGQASNGSFNVQSTSTIVAGEWQHVAFTAKDGEQKLYHNGVLKTTATNSTVEENGSHFAIGSGNHLGTPNSFFNGQIDEVAMWDAYLTESDVTSIYNNGKVIDLSNSTAYAVDRTANLELWLRCGDKAEPESTTSIARSDFYTDFDGTDDVVELGSDASIDNVFVGGATLTAWINPSSDGENNFGRIFDKSTATSGADGFYFLVTDESSGNCELRFAHGFDSTVGFWDSTATVALNTWNHVAVAYNNSSTSNNPIFYINGVSVTVTEGDAPSGTVADDSSQNLFIGNNTGGDRTFAGGISSASIYKTLLDAQTISQMAKSRFTPMRDNRFSVVDFDGTNDHIVVSDNSALDFGTGDFTVALWHKSDAQHDQPFINKKTTFSDNTAGWTIYMENGNDQMRCRIAGGSSNVAVSAGTKSVSDNNWHFTTMVRSGDNLYLYTDGVLEGSTTGVNSLDVDNSDDLYIGRGGSLYPQISVSSVSLYNVAKSAEEVYAIYQKGITYDESSLSGLVGYWRMGDDTSKAYPTIADSSSNSNDGTITNGASDDIVQQMVAGYDMGAFESNSEELGGSELANASSGNFVGVSSNDWTEEANGDITFSNNQMVVEKTGSGTNIIIADSGFFKTSTMPQKFLKITADVDSSTTGTWYFRSMFGSATAGIFDTPETDLTAGQTMSAYGLMDNTGAKLRLYGTGSVGTKLVLNSFEVKEVLQSEVSDTYPLLVDVNNPVISQDLQTGTWNNSDLVGFTGASADGFTAVNTDSGQGNDDNAYGNQISFTAGKTYKIEFTITANSGVALPTIHYGVNSAVTGDTDATQANVSGAGSNSMTFTPSSTLTNYYPYVRIGANAVYNFTISDYQIIEYKGNTGTMTNQATSDLVYSSVLPDQSFLTGVNSAYNFIDLDGSDEFIASSSNIGISGSNAYTMNCWFKLDAYGSFPVLMSSGEIAGYKENSLLIRTDHNTVGWGNQIGANDFANASGTTISLNTWFMATLTFNGSDTIRIYINGALDGTKSVSSINITNSVLYIGKRVTGLFLNGQITQCSVFNKTLSATEVSAIYDLTRHGNLLDSYSDNLLGYFAMGALDGTTGLSDVGDGTIYDRSGNSNHGTATNTESADLKSSPNAEPNGYAKGDTNRSTTTP